MTIPDLCSGGEGTGEPETPYHTNLFKLNSLNFCLETKMLIYVKSIWPTTLCSIQNSRKKTIKYDEKPHFCLTMQLYSCSTVYKILYYPTVSEPVRWYQTL